MLLSLLDSLMEEPLNDILRTKEQLGYLIYTTVSDARGNLGFTITVGAPVALNLTFGFVNR